MLYYFRIKEKQRIELLKDYTKEERKAFFKALNDISSVLGDAFHRYDTKQK